MGLDGTLYDQVLDTIFYLGLAPERFSVSHSQATAMSTLPILLRKPYTLFMLEAWRQPLHTLLMHLLILCHVIVSTCQPDQFDVLLCAELFARLQG